ncbi:hypothetical protein ACOSQ3_011865 [Xanthoceras sorbifolium]
MVGDVASAECLMINLLVPSLDAALVLLLVAAPSAPAPACLRIQVLKGGIGYAGLDNYNKSNKTVQDGIKCPSEIGYVACYAMLLIKASLTLFHSHLNVTLTLEKLKRSRSNFTYVVMAEAANSVDTTVSNNESNLQTSYKWWIKMGIYSVFTITGQSTAQLLGRLYYAEGGNCKWLSALVQNVGFPLLFPLYLIFSSKNPTSSDDDDDNKEESPSLLVLATAYVAVGLLIAAHGICYSIGYKYLPVSTYSLICTTQLGFNALFSLFLNSLKLTPYIINSLILLTLSSVVLIFQNDDSITGSTTKDDKGNHVVGIVFTILASAGDGLILSLTQLFIEKVLKKQTFKVVLDMIVYPSIASCSAILVGLFASGEWMDLNTEMEGFKLGKISYLMTLIWTAVSWQVCSIGLIGLIFEVSSLFSNVISTLGLPTVPVLAVIFFHDKMSGAKVVALVLAFWGFVSYAYQHYLDNRSYKNSDIEAPKDPITTLKL